MVMGVWIYKGKMRVGGEGGKEGGRGGRDGRKRGGWERGRREGEG